MAKARPGRPREFGNRVTLAIRIDPEVRRVLKVEAAENDRPLGREVERILRAELERRGWDLPE